MPVEVILPKVDMDMATGSIASWHVAEGDSVAKGDPLFDIETDKAAMEVESPASGTLHHICVDQGVDVPIGTVLAWIYADGETVGPAPEQSAADAPAPAQAEQKQAPDRGPSEQSDDTPTHASHTEKVRATPAARQLARDHQLDIETLTGSGPLGRIGRADVETHLDQSGIAVPASAPANWSEQPGALPILASGKGTDTPIVLIHGFAADASGWNVIEKTLAKTSPVYRIELPNHGGAPRRRVNDFTDLVSQVRQAFDTLNLTTAHLVGHSLGGAVALALADTRARKIQKLTLLSPAGLGPHINGDILSGLARATRAESLGPWLRQLTGDPTAITDSYVRVAMTGRSDPALRAAQASMMGELFPDGVQAFDVRGALKRLTCPARIIAGKKDAVIPWHHALEAPGQVSLNLFADIGHLPHVEIPQEVVALLKG